MKLFKGFVSVVLALAIFMGALFTAGKGININTKAESDVRASQPSYWSGNAANSFAGGSGAKDDPYIIETADQFYRALTQITDTTEGVEKAESVAGGYQSDKILKQGSIDVYVPVYTPYYYKVADGVSAIYLNDISGNESLEGIKSFVANSAKKDWKPGKVFVGNLDGNGVTIYGMYCSTGQGLVYKLDGSATVKNFNFDSCYSSGSGNSALVTTNLGLYTNDSTIHNIAGISVRNSYIASTRNINLSQRSDNGLYQYNSGAAGIVSTQSTCENLIISNCFYDGYSCERIVNSSVDRVTPNMIGAIISGGHGMNNVEINSCVALGAPIVDEVCVKGKEVFYNRYDKNQGFQVCFFNSYSDISSQIPLKYPNKYDKLLDIVRVEAKNEYTVYDMPGLNWKNNWQLVTVYNGATKRLIPMPMTSLSADSSNSTYASLIAGQLNNGGAYNLFGGANVRGTYGMNHKIMGSGTQDDPYLISNAFELARAIASGGMNVFNRLYYKLTCDIDASQAIWITQDTLGSATNTKYKYVPFGGVLDGDGYAVTNLYVGDDQSVGLIPVLAENGVVKNIHIRNSSFISGSGYAGAIAGEVKAGAVVSGCSVENCLVASYAADSHIVGNCKNGLIENSYYIADDNSTTATKTAYYNNKGVIGTIDVAKNQDVWYRGGADGSTPKLKNFAAARNLADIDGDGNTDEYTAIDIVTLRRAILEAPGYENVYGDVNRDGQINISDLAALSRSIVGDFDKLYDGFWRNANLGKIKIYYGENDNYDAARRLEIYLEQELDGVDIQKVVSAKKTVSGTNSDSSAVYVHANDITGTPTGMLEIIVGDISNYDKYSDNNHNTNDYSITYDEQNCVLWLNGGSFTGVEQAVLDFISNSDFKTGKVYTVDKATLAPEKRATTVMVDTDFDGKADTEKTFYYAWGDEFNGIKDAADGENAEISLDTWNYNVMNTESNRGTAGNYRNLQGANRDEMSKLYWVEDGKLTITRGVKAEHATAVTDRLGYARLYNQTGTDAFGGEIDDEDIIANPGLIKTNHSMIYKQGYSEMYGRLPSDGHTFASWWMLGHGNYNNTFFTESLYSKVYKLNNKGEYAYDGVSSVMDSTNLKTFKYQVPTTHFEIDIWELMQNPSIAHSSIYKTKTTGSYDYRLYLNVHKFYAVGSNKASTVNVIDWDNPGTPRGVMKKEWFGTPADDYYFSTSAAWHDFTDGKVTRYSTTKGGFLNLQTIVSANYVETLQKQLTAPRRYGFYWCTNGVDKFNFTLYIYDINGDGIEGDDAILGTSDMTYNTQDKMNPQNYDIVNDAETANQYMYILFDNVLYSSNPNHQNATSDLAVMHTDMLTDEGTAANPDKIDLEIDYIRVYQADGRRDIITEMTEDFNNGNHFGY